MRRDFITVTACASLLEAQRVMHLARLRHVCVESQGMLVGLLSYRDLQDHALARLSAGASGAGAGERDLADAESVRDAMRAAPFTAAPEVPLREAAQRLCRLRIGCLPVVENSPHGTRLVGIVTESDLLLAAAKLF